MGGVGTVGVGVGIGEGVGGWITDLPDNAAFQIHLYSCTDEGNKNKNKT